MILGSVTIWILLLWHVVGGERLLLQLPGHPDPNADVLFNMQTRRMEEVIYLSKVSDRTLVEPHYLFGARNWTWFETSNHNSVATNQQIHQGVLGTISEPLSTFFELPPIEKELGRQVVKMSEYAGQHNGELDLIVRFFGGDFPPCDSADTHVDAYGISFRALKVICISRYAVPSVPDFVELMKDYELVGIHYLPPKFVEFRVHSWRQTAERWSIRSALEWSRPLIDQAEEFIRTHLVSESGGDEFVGVHWRRGDRAYREEMGIHGVVDVALTSMERMVPFVQDVSHGMEEVGPVFLATNCGNEEDLSFVLENLGAKRYIGSRQWHDAAREAVIEQIIMSKAAVIVVPPGVGNPPEVNDTSNFSLFVLEQRRINAAKLGYEAPPYHMCCGTSPVLTWWRPFPSSVYPHGGKVHFRAWGAFIPPGTEAQIRLLRGSDIISTLPVQAPGDVVVYALPQGSYQAELGLSWTEDDVDGSEMTSFGALEFEVETNLCADSTLDLSSGPMVKWSAGPVTAILNLDEGQLPLLEGTFETANGHSVEVLWHPTETEDLLQDCACRCAAQASCFAVLAMPQSGSSPSGLPRCGTLSSGSSGELLMEITGQPGQPGGGGLDEIEVAIKLAAEERLGTDRIGGCLNLDYVCMYAS